MTNPIRVFVSSTWIDLQLERKAVEEALHRIRDAHFSGMEYFGSRPDTPKAVSLSEVDCSDVYIGIFGHRYGSGITEDEYRRARERDIPCLIYLKADDEAVPPTHTESDPEKAKKLERLKNDLKTYHTISVFADPKQLAVKVVADLHNLLTEIAQTLSGPETQEHSDQIAKYNISVTNSQGVIIGDGARIIQNFGTEVKRQRLRSDPVGSERFSDDRISPLASILNISRENNGRPHKAGPSQWWVRLRIESQKPLNGLCGEIYDIQWLKSSTGLEGESLQRFVVSRLSWARKNGLFSPISVNSHNVEYLDLAWRSVNDPIIPANELRVASALDEGERSTKSPTWGQRQDFIPLTPGYFLFVIRIMAEACEIPLVCRYYLHWPDIGQEDNIRLTEAPVVPGV